MAKHYDIAIVGGGLSGAVTALALAQACSASGKAWKILLVDNQPAPADNNASNSIGSRDDVRSTALSETSASYLQYLGMESLVEQSQAIHSIHISQRNGFGATELYHHEQNLPALGYVIDNNILLNSALQAASSYADNIDYRYEQQLIATELKQGAKQPTRQLTLQSIHNENQTEQVTASLVIGADGTQSTLSKLLENPIKIINFNQVALVSNVQIALKKQQATNTAWERFTRQGPIALLPISAKENGTQWFNLVWCQSHMGDWKGERAEIFSRSDDELITKLQGLLAGRIGTVKKMGKKGVFPLQYQSSEKCYADNAVLLGNAAQTLHPVAGQGFNLGLRDIATLAEQILETPELESSNIDWTLLLAKYAQLREQDTTMTQQFTNTVATVFGIGLLPVATARSGGLLALSAHAKLRNVVAKHNMGYRGYLPKAMQTTGMEATK